MRTKESEGTCDRCGIKAIAYTEVEDNGQIIEVCKDCVKDKLKR